jgi:hypothetical protein
MKTIKKIAAAVAAAACAMSLTACSGDIGETIDRIDGFQKSIDDALNTLDEMSGENYQNGSPSAPAPSITTTFAPAPADEANPAPNIDTPPVKAPYEEEPYSNKQDTLAMLSELQVAPKMSGDGYDREEYFGGWQDLDGNGCDTREDVLSRDLRNVRMNPKFCQVEYGVFDDPYSGEKDREYIKGENSRVIDIEHIVALKNAYQTGAGHDRWPLEKRLAIANDPLNLLVVDGPLNRSKGDKDITEWTPEKTNPDFMCRYATRQVQVKHKYGLWVTPEEKAKMQEVVNDWCVF